MFTSQDWCVLFFFIKYSQDVILISQTKYKSNYSKRITSGILGLPHKKRLFDVSLCCSSLIACNAIDIGCNDLFFDQKIIPHQKSFTGCDLNWENGLDLAKKNIEKYGWSNVQLVKAAGEHLPFIDNVFDLILSFETLEHVQDEIYVLRDIKRISKDNAILVVSAPTEFGPILFFKQFFRWAIYGDQQYSLKELFYGSVLCDLSKVGRVKHDHKGYDYRNTIDLLNPEFVLIQKINTPVRYLPDSFSYGTILIFKKLNNYKG
jgi:SAM-dependent methyltransferase